jgi:hypothetical protein
MMTKDLDTSQRRILMSLLMLLMLLMVLVESSVLILVFRDMLHSPWMDRGYINPLSETAIIGRFDIWTRFSTSVLALSGRSRTSWWMTMNGRTVRMTMTMRGPNITMRVSKVQIEGWISTMRMCVSRDFIIVASIHRHTSILHFHIETIDLHLIGTLMMMMMVLIRTSAITA